MKKIVLFIIPLILYLGCKSQSIQTTQEMEIPFEIIREFTLDQGATSKRLLNQQEFEKNLQLLPPFNNRSSPIALIDFEEYNLFMVVYPLEHGIDKNINSIKEQSNNFFYTTESFTTSHELKKYKYVFVQLPKKVERLTPL